MHRCYPEGSEGSRATGPRGRDSLRIALNDKRLKDGPIEIPEVGPDPVTVSAPVHPFQRPVQFLWYVDKAIVSRSDSERSTKLRYPIAGTV